MDSFVEFQRYTAIYLACIESPVGYYVGISEVWGN